MSNIKITEDDFYIEIQDSVEDVDWREKLRAFYNALRGQGYYFSSEEANKFEELLESL